jgi:branched-chain amino acid transport system permease protein
LDLIVATISNVLVLSAMYMLVALGFAFLFSMLGILNLAHGAIYMISGYVGFVLIRAWGIEHWLGLLLTTLIVAAFGVFLEKFCFRPFVGNFNRIVMIGVALTVILQTTVNIIAGTKLLAIPTFWGGLFEAGPIAVSHERIITFAIGAALLSATVWFVNRTKWGQQMQAIAQNAESAALQGINVHRISSLACGLGCGLAAIAGCLMGAYSGLGPFVGDFMLVKTLMLVILAGVGSIGGIFVTGLVLGSLNAILPVLTSGATSEAIAVGIVVVLLLIKPEGFFGHEAEGASDAESVEGKVLAGETGRRKWAKLGFYGGLLFVLALVPVFSDSPYKLHILIMSFIFIIASMSLRTIVVSGQFPLAHGAFMGIGSYVSGMIARWLGWPVWIAIPCGALASMALGILTGYPFSRLRALYYALGSLFFGIGVIHVVNAFGIYTGSYSGLTGIPPLFTSKLTYYYFFLGLALASALFLYRFEFSRIGIVLKAIAQSHVVASSVGISEGFYRILAVAVGCFFAGLAGAGYAHYSSLVSPYTFNFLATLWLVMYVLIGGIDSFAGPIVGTLILFLIPEAFRDLKIYAPFISAVILLFVVYVLPKGLASLPEVIFSKRGEGKRGKRIAHAP